MIMRDMVGVQSFLLQGPPIDPSAAVSEQRHLQELVLDPSQASGRLPPPWEQCLDLRSGKMFFKNRSTGEITSTDPRRNYVEFEFIGARSDNHGGDPSQHVHFQNVHVHDSLGDGHVIDDGTNRGLPRVEQPLSQHVDLDLRLSSAGGSLPSAAPISVSAGATPLSSASSSSTSSSNVSDGNYGSAIVFGNGDAADNDQIPIASRPLSRTFPMNSNDSSPEADRRTCNNSLLPFPTTHSCYSADHRLADLHNAHHHELLADLSPRQINRDNVAHSPTTTSISTISSNSSFGAAYNSALTSPDNSVMSYQQPSTNIGSDSSTKDGSRVIDANYDSIGLQMVAAACMRCLMYVLLEVNNGQPKCPQCGCPAVLLNYTT